MKIALIKRWPGGLANPENDGWLGQEDVELICPVGSEAIGESVRDADGVVADCGRGGIFTDRALAATLRAVAFGKPAALVGAVWCAYPVRDLLPEAVSSHQTWREALEVVVARVRGL